MLVSMGIKRKCLNLRILKAVNKKMCTYACTQFALLYSALHLGISKTH